MKMKLKQQKTPSNNNTGNNAYEKRRTKKSKFITFRSAKNRFRNTWKTKERFIRWNWNNKKIPSYTFVLGYVGNSYRSKHLAWQWKGRRSFKEKLKVWGRKSRGKRTEKSSLTRNLLLNFPTNFVTPLSGCHYELNEITKLLCTILIK